MSESAEPRLVGGIHTVRNLLRHGPERILEAWIDSARKDQRIQDLVREFRQLDLRFFATDRKQLDQLAPGINHQGVLVRTRAATALNEQALYAILDQLEANPQSAPIFLLVLDGVQDPHNLGACLRTAEAAGVHAVIAPKDRSVGLTPVVSKVASGAAETIPFVQVTNLVRVLEHLADVYRVWRIGAAGEADTAFYDIDLRAAIAIVMGAEGKGMRRLTREHCDQLVALPMAGAVESLNVSVAAGVMLFEAVRQRKAEKNP
jgi:23S rRNA (guanosine2251-2'-O)-methyltransferase